MKSFQILFLLLALSPLGLTAQNLSISESIDYLNDHLRDFDLIDEEWENIEYDEENNALLIEYYIGFGDVLYTTLNLDCNFWYEEYRDEEYGDLMVVYFENNDVVLLYPFEEYYTNQFYFANYSAKNTKVLLDLLDLIHYKSK